MKSFREIGISAVALMLIGGIITAALAGTNALTKPTIDKRAAEVENAARREVIDAAEFTSETLTVGEDTVTYYEAKQDGQTVGYVFTASAVGKSSGLTVMTGISVDGNITGVKITEESETAGYVTKVIKAGLLEEIKGHDATSLTDVDAVAQATKTSNGIKTAVEQAIAWYSGVKGGGAQ